MRVSLFTTLVLPLALGLLPHAAWADSSLNRIQNARVEARDLLRKALANPSIRKDQSLWFAAQRVLAAYSDRDTIQFRVGSGTESGCGDAYAYTYARGHGATPAPVSVCPEGMQLPVNQLAKTLIHEGFHTADGISNECTTDRYEDEIVILAGGKPMADGYTETCGLQKLSQVFELPHLMGGAIGNPNSGPASMSAAVSAAVSASVSDRNEASWASEAASKGIDEASANRTFESTNLPYATRANYR